MANERLKIDVNKRQVSGAVTNDANLEIRMVRMDDTTKGIIVYTGGSAALTAIANGQNTVTSAGTAEVLATTQAVKAVTIKALSTNTGSIWVGDSGVDSTNGYELFCLDSVTFSIDDPVKIYIDASVTGEGVSFALLS